jgi:hypothetical protein
MMNLAMTLAIKPMMDDESPDYAHKFLPENSCCLAARLIPNTKDLRWQRDLLVAVPICGGRSISSRYGRPTS